MRYLYLTLLSLFLSVSSFAIVPITGSKTVCVSFTTQLTDATPGGSWSSSVTTIASVDTNGLVKGVSAGTATITYAIGPGHATMTITVNAFAPIIGSTVVCAGSSIILTDVLTGGAWTSSNTTVATVGSAYGHSTVTGTGAGLDTISYTLTTGCVASAIVTVNPLPGPIIGTKSVCIGSVSTLTDASFNGTWSSSVPGIAKANRLSGDITGMTTGLSIITYTLPTGCIMTTTMTVNPLPGAIAGVTHAFHGSQVTLTDPSPGGTWAVDYPFIATIGSSSGTVTGISGGFATITYKLSTTGCESFARFSVDGLPDSGGTYALTAWWPFCNDLIDHSGGGNTLNNTAKAGSVPSPDTVSRFGAVNGAHKFTGPNQMMWRTPAFPTATASGDYTFSCWIYPEGDQSAIIMFDGAPLTDGIGLVINSGVSGTPGHRVGVQVGGGGLYLCTPLTVDPSNMALNGLWMWHNLILEKKGSTITLYMDSMSVGFFVAPITTPTQGFSVGNDITNPTNGFTGLIDDITIYNTGITPNQRADLYYYNPDIIPFSLGNDTTLCTNTITLQPKPQEQGLAYYMWSTADSLDTIIVVHPPSLGPGMGTNYSLTMSKPYGCSLTDGINVYVRPLPINLGNDTSICLGDTVRVNASYPGATYVWNTGATTPTIPITQTGQYWVTVDSSICSGTDSITVNAYQSPHLDLGPDVSSCNGKPDTIQNIYQSENTGYTLLWSNGTSYDSLVTTVTGTFWLNITNGGCSRTDTMHVLIVYDTFSLLSKDTAICKGRFVTANSTFNPIVNYQWTPTTGIPISNLPSPNIYPDTSATYVVTGSFPGCPDIKYSFHIDVQPNPIVYIGGNRQLCLYDTVHINAVVTPSWYDKYIFNWTPTGNIDFPNDQAIVFRAGDTTNLQVSVTTTAGCVGTDSAYIVVHPGGFDSLVSDVSVCPRESVPLSAIMHTIGAGVGTVATYTWHPGVFFNDSTLINPVLNAVTSGEFSAIGTSQYGCMDTLHFRVTVNPGAVLYLGDSQTIHPGGSYQVPTQTNCVYFSWFPSIGVSDTNSADPTLTPPYNTYYRVRAATEAGCWVDESLSIRVNPSTLMAIPNAFHPGPGPNGILYVIKQGAAVMNYIRIYNRWGVEVFESNDITKGWDGTYKGVAQPMGVYVYELEATTAYGSVFQQQGNVTLIR